MIHHFLAVGLQLFQVGTFAAVMRFLIVYVRRAPTWYKSAEGRYLVVSKAAFALILALGMVAAVWPGWAHWRLPK